MHRHLLQLCQRLPELQGLAADIAAACDLCVQSLRAGGTLHICGNGGSRADAEHIAGELLKGFLRPRTPPASEQAQWVARFGDDGRRLARSLQQGLRAQVLGADHALCTAVSNDRDPDLIFAQPLYVLGRPGDALLALSTSGNARNVLAACQVAACRGIPILGLTGAEGGRLAQIAQICLKVPAVETYLVQELHLPVYHCLCAMLEDAFFAP